MVARGRRSVATRQELMEGLQSVRAQARLVAGMLDATDEWDVKRPAGWTAKEMFAHVASTVGMMAKIGPNILRMPPEVDVIAGLDMAAVNEQGVAPMRSMDGGQAAEALLGSCGKTSDWVASLTDEELEGVHTFRGMPMTMSDYVMMVGVMHSTHHLFEAPLSVSA